MNQLLAILLSASLLMMSAISAFAQGPPADLVVQHAKVTTQNPEQPTATAFAVRKGRLVKVGSDADVQSSIGPDTQVIDAGGRRVIPGLIDSHSHYLVATNLFILDERGCTGSHLAVS